jgi:hypothetical protein
VFLELGYAGFKKRLRLLAVLNAAKLDGKTLLK